jgi:hypothetical protein
MQIPYRDIRIVETVQLPYIPPSNEKLIISKYSKLPAISSLTENKLNQSPAERVQQKRVVNLSFPRAIRGRARVEKIEQEFLTRQAADYESLVDMQKRVVSSSVLEQHSNVVSRKPSRDNSEAVSRKPSGMNSTDFPVIKARMGNDAKRPSVLTPIKSVKMTATQRYSKFVKSLDAGLEKEGLDTMDQMSKDLKSLTRSLQTWVDENLEDDKVVEGVEDADFLNHSSTGRDSVVLPPKEGRDFGLGLYMAKID